MKHHNFFENPSMKFLLPARVAESILFATGLANKTFNFLGFPIFLHLEQTDQLQCTLISLHHLFYQKHQISNKFSFVENKERNVIFMNF